MTSPALGVAYSFWLKARWMFALVLATVLGGVVASLAMAWAREFILTAYLGIMLFELTIVLNVFVYGSFDFAKKSSAFPAHMLVLPATSRQLVGWPMLFCAAFFAGMWNVVVLCHAADCHDQLRESQNRGRGDRRNHLLGNCAGVVRRLGSTRGQPFESARIAHSHGAQRGHTAIVCRGHVGNFRFGVLHVAEFSVGNVARAVWPQMGA